MADLTVYGFQVSTYVNIVRLVLAEKGADYRFHDLAGEMGGPRHLALHPFGRVPVIDHDGFVLYETAAIALYLDEALPGPSLQPAEVRDRARMHRWISTVNAYSYPYMAFHLGHERLIYPALGIEPDEKVVAAALPKIDRCLEVMAADLADGRDYLVGGFSLADLFALPSLTTLARTPEGAARLPAHPAVLAWLARMQQRPAAQAVLAMVGPHIGQPLEHARSWVENHRPRY
ncbi:MAG TPA: glutathione S-transferase family protein [Caulobacter sp.]|nr:glutathione S-transferase family protein [Caulobacter sp.]